MVTPSKTLVDFHRKYCPEIPIDSSAIIFKLLEKIEEVKERKDSEKFFSTKGGEKEI